MDITWKNQVREEFHEIAIYEVSEGEIIKEQFYAMGTSFLSNYENSVVISF